MLPPAPLGATCPLWLLVEWAEVFRNGLRSRSRVLLEVNPASGPASHGERWLALVTWRSGGTPLPQVLPPALRRECGLQRSGQMDRQDVASVFEQMRFRAASVWLVPLSAWGGSAVFVRKPASDPTLAELEALNRESKAPRKWRLPKLRCYPAALLRTTGQSFTASVCPCDGSDARRRIAAPEARSRGTAAQRGSS